MIEPSLWTDHSCTGWCISIWWECLEVIELLNVLAKSDCIFVVDDETETSVMRTHNEASTSNDTGIFYYNNLYSLLYIYIYNNNKGNKRRRVNTEKQDVVESRVF